MKLIIAEKPSVAQAIAKVVGAATLGNGYLSGSGYIVSWCYGHLIELADPVTYDPELKHWSLSTLPILPDPFQTVVSSATEKQYNVLKSLLRRGDVDEIIEATDAGREGELIFRLVYEQAGCCRPFSRLWISSLEEKSIRDGLERRKPGNEYDTLFAAAKCRQRADWLMGINLTRLYTKMYNTKLPCGRVQTPTINLIVQRQRDIEDFKPLPFYVLTADLGNFCAAVRIDDKTAAEAMAARCKGQNAVVKQAEKQEKKEATAPLYDLTTLQRDANRLLGYSAQDTLDNLQKLYEAKLATYPRTDSRYITADQADSTIALIDTLMGSGIFSPDFISAYNRGFTDVSRIVNDAKVTDHHAVLPTASVSPEKMRSLPPEQRNILLLILYRLLSAVYAPYAYTSVKAVLTIGSDEFTATGREVRELGFRQVEAALRTALQGDNTSPSDNPLPELKAGDTYPVQEMNMEERFTQPPKAYTEDTLLSAMETAGKAIDDEALRDAMKDSGLGTPATRAGIIENIIKTGYIRREGKKLLPTEMAEKFMTIVTDRLKSPELTGSWEKQLADIQGGNLSEEDFMCSVTDFLRKNIPAAVASYDPVQSDKVFPIENNGLGICPRCGRKVIDFPKSYSCESGRDGCGFVIWKQIGKKNISIAQVQQLLTKGHTGVIKGFTSKAGKPFDAALALDTDKKIIFDFQNSSNQKK